MGRLLPRRSGFTLVELLVVIGIIALLISILLPSLGRAREAGRRVSCMSKLRQISNAVLMYHNEWKSLPGPVIPAILDPAVINDPLGVMSGSASKDLDRKYNLSNENFLYRYLSKSREVYYCPSNAALRESGTAGPASVDYKGAVLGYSYLINNKDTTFEPYYFGSWFLTDPARFIIPKKLNNVKAPFNPNSPVAATRTKFANTQAGANPSRIWMVADIDGRNFSEVTSTKYGIDSKLVTDLTKRRFQPPHPAGKPGRNYSFFDGHAEWRLADDDDPYNADEHNK